MGFKKPYRSAWSGCFFVRELQSNQSSQNLIAGVFFLSHVALVYAIWVDMKEPPQGSFPLPRCCLLQYLLPLSLSRAGQLWLCVLPQRLWRSSMRPIWRKSPQAREPTQQPMLQLLGALSPQLCATRRPVQSGALPRTEATPLHWRLQALFTTLETLNDVVFNMKTPRAPLLLGRPSANRVFLQSFPSSCGTHRRWQSATVENLLHIKATPSFFFFTRFTELFIPTPHAPNATSVYIFVQPTRLFLLKNHMPYLFRHVANTPCSLPLPLALPASDSVTPILAGAAEGDLRNVSVLASALWHGFSLGREKIIQLLQ